MEPVFKPVWPAMVVSSRLYLNHDGLVVLSTHGEVLPSKPALVTTFGSGVGEGDADVVVVV